MGGRATRLNYPRRVRYAEIAIQYRVINATEYLSAFFTLCHSCCRGLWPCIDPAMEILSTAPLPPLLCLFTQPHESHQRIWSKLTVSTDHIIRRIFGMSNISLTQARLCFTDEQQLTAIHRYILRVGFLATLPLCRCHFTFVTSSEKNAGLHDSEPHFLAAGIFYIAGKIFRENLSISVFQIHTLIRAPRFTSTSWCPWKPSGRAVNRQQYCTDNLDDR